MSANHVVVANLGALVRTKGTGLWELQCERATWKPLGKPTASKALFLELSAEIRFTPLSNTKPRRG